MDEQRTPVVAERPPTTAPEAIERLLDRIPALAGKRREFGELSGGLTNRNYKVVAADSSYVVRVSGNEPELLLINRDNEFHNSAAAAAAGVGAPVIDYIPEHGLLMIGFIEGVTFTDEMVKTSRNLTRIAQSCRRLHSGRRFVNDFDMATIQEDYLAIVQERGFRLPTGYLDNMDAIRRVRAALDAKPARTVPCNNDLLAGNFVDDGEQVWLIDYEYSGNNDPCFELGNIWSECHLSTDELEELVTAYYGRQRRNKIARAQLQGLMSKYGWTLWAAIQRATSGIDFDFWTWGLEKYETAIEIFTGREFNRLLEDAQRED